VRLTGLLAPPVVGVDGGVESPISARNGIISSESNTRTGEAAPENAGGQRLGRRPGRQSLLPDADRPSASPTRIAGPPAGAATENEIVLAQWRCRIPESVVADSVGWLTSDA